MPANKHRCMNRWSELLEILANMDDCFFRSNNDA